jgi:hypothetical protein
LLLCMVSFLYIIITMTICNWMLTLFDQLSFSFWWIVNVNV